MSHDYLRRTVRIGLGACALLVAAPALAADLAYPYPSEPGPAPSRIYREERIEEQVPPPPPRAGPAFADPRFADGPPPAESCRTIVKRRIDADGEEVVRRVRVCDETAYPAPRPHYRPSGYDPGPPPGPPRDPSLVPPADVPDEGYDEPQGW